MILRVGLVDVALQGSTNMIQPKLYYAHPISDYNTPYEERMMRMLQGFSRDGMENPNQKHHQIGYEKHGMDYFLDLCSGLDGCIFDTFPGGIIGAGVAKEVQSFLDAGKPVWQVIDCVTFAAVAIVTELNLAHVATRDTTRELSKLFRAIGRS
jgi:hypothetical protein